MNLLLVDDEFHVRKKLMQKIDWKTLGIDRLLEAGDGEQGYELAVNEPIDIIISDIRMPRMDGIEMAAKIRELYPGCVILFLSGYSDKEYLRSAISLHALQYIDKPVLPEQVISAVKEAVSYCNNLRNTSFAAKIKEVPGPAALHSKTGCRPAVLSPGRVLAFYSGLLRFPDNFDTASDRRWDSLRPA